MNIWQDLKMKFHQGNMIIRLIMTNVGVYITSWLVAVFIFMVAADRFVVWTFIKDWLYLPAELADFPSHFWTPFTYMFLHVGIWHLFFNMLVLYIFGQKLGDLLSDRHVLPIYLWGGLMGALFFLIGFNILPAFQESTGNLVGASAGVMAVVLAAATVNPRGNFYLPFIGKPIQLQYIAALCLFIDLVGVLGRNPGGALAHLGGAFMGWLYVKQLGKGNDWSKPVQAVIDRFNGNNKPKQQRRPKPQQRAKTSSQQGSFRATMQVHKGSAASDYFGNEYSRSFVQKYKSMSKEECLDSILDKIKRSGYDSLTKDEKVFLDRYRDR